MTCPWPTRFTCPTNYVAQSSEEWVQWYCCCQFMSLRLLFCLVHGCHCLRALHTDGGVCISIIFLCDASMCTVSWFCSARLCSSTSNWWISTWVMIWIGIKELNKGLFGQCLVISCGVRGIKKFMLWIFRGWFIKHNMF